MGLLINIKLLWVFVLITLLGCGSVNRKAETQQMETKSITENGFFENEEKKEQPSVVIEASGNSQVTLGDKALETKTKKETKKIVSNKTFWDMSFKDAYEQYSVYTWIFLGIGLVLIVLAIKWFQSTMFGKSVAGGLRVFDSITEIIKNKLRHLSPNSEAYKRYQEMLDEVSHKKDSLKSKRKPI